MTPHPDEEGKIQPQLLFASSPLKSNQSTPCRASAIKQPAGVNGANTPTRERSANKARTPATTPNRTRSRKPEPSLLNDFLLGRPSPNRTRRRSLEVVKKEMRQDNVEKVAQPGGVKDRVNQWAKASAAAVIEPDTKDEAADLDAIVVEYEDSSADEELRKRVKYRQGQKPKDVEDAAVVEKKGKSAPKKRVISDDHWMKNTLQTTPKKPPSKREKPVATLPKDFTRDNGINPPLERKLDDWVQRTEKQAKPEVFQTPKKQASRPQTPDDGNRVYHWPSASSEDGIKADHSSPAKTSDPRSKSAARRDRLAAPVDMNKVSQDSGKKDTSRKVSDAVINKDRQGLMEQTRKYRINADRPSNQEFQDDIRIKPIRRARTKAHQDNLHAKEHPTEGFDRGSRLSSSPNVENGPTRNFSYETSLADDERRAVLDHDEIEEQSGTAESLEDVPFGNSAFSVLDLPVGADAHTMRQTMRKPSKPQRAPSFRVPQVLKKVYTEGMKIMHDTVDPPIVGVNQPRSIESWLHNTTDPFVDQPITHNIHTAHPEEPPRKPSYNEDDQTEKDLTAERRTRHRRSNQSHEEFDSLTDQACDDFNWETHGRTRRVSKQSEKVSGEGDTSPLSPTGLKRSPATRISSSPIKATKKVPFKEALMDAFRGESTTIRPKLAPFPLADITSVRETDNIPAVPDVRVSDYDKKVSMDPQRSRGRKLPEIPSSKESKEDDPLPRPPAHGRRPPPTNGVHCLSTIASVETFTTASTAVDGASQPTQTTVSRDTLLSASPKERKPSMRRKHSKSGSKKRLTKHSDLVSMLSLPDSAPPGRATSIKSARSVRTTRRPLEKATIEDVMREVAGDESKYMRELKTLVDGVVPVLLTSVLSKSKEAEAAGLFNPNSTEAYDTVFTQPIVDMGVALEKLKSLHKRIPLSDPDAFIAWAHRAHRTYSDYIRAWRLGFQDVVVNLAPASRSSSAEEKSILEDVPRNERGDVVDSDGDRVDVAFLLKRPMARIKYLVKATKGIAKLKPSNLADNIASIYDNLLEQARRRTREEEANLEDRLASNVDPSRARDPRTMAPMQDVKVDPTLKVMAKDYFSLMYKSSGGQRIECRVELFLRGLEGDTSKGDVLICFVDDFSRYLLFPPIAKDRISARLDEGTQHLYIVIRSPRNSEESSAEWHEQVDLEAEFYDTAAEWVDMLGVMSEMPPHELTDAPSTHAPLPFSNFNPKPESKQARWSNHGVSSTDDSEIPIGARRRRATRLATNPLSQRTKSADENRPLNSSPSKRMHDEKSKSPETNVSPTPEALKKEAKLAHDSPPSTPQSRSRYHSPVRPSASRAISDPTNSSFQDTLSGPNHKRPIDAQQRTAELPFIPKVRKNKSAADMEDISSPNHRSPNGVKVSQRPRHEDPLTSHSKDVRANDIPPPPPVHKTPPNVLNKSPYLETPTPKVRHRRTSSPLKHEYQPSDASGTSASEGENSSADGHETSEDSSDEELEGANIPNPMPNAAGIYSKRVSRSEPVYDLPDATLAPSNSASQAPYRGVPAVRDSDQSKRIIATISSWSDKRGCWEDLWNESCSVVISPGLIEVYEISATHSSPDSDGMIVSSGSSGTNAKSDTGAKTPIIGQVLTPCVPLRQSTMIDIEIKSPPTANSRTKCSSSIRYRALNTIACGEMYQAVHQARLDNIVYKRLEAERTIAGYGSNPYEKVVQRRSWLFGRRKSYRAPRRELSIPTDPLADASDDLQSTSPSNFTSAPSFLKRFSRGSFNISRSSVARNSYFPPGSDSFYTSSSSDGITPPRTPSTPSISLSGTQNSRWSFSGSTPVDLGSSNLKIRLYCLETASKWNDTGAALLTVTAPPRGMHSESSLYHGIERRVLLTRHTLEVDKLPDHSIQGTSEDVVFDRILGGGCFSKIGRTGICVNVWEDIRGPNGEVGMVGKVGGVSGTTKKWCFQTACSYDANWIYNLVAVGR